jgi:hypothetical protein
MAQIVLAQTDSPTAPSAGQTAFSFPATALNQFKWVDADGGTNILDLGGKTLTVSQNLTLAGATGKTLTLTGSLIVPADGTAALLGTANAFTAAQTMPGLAVGTTVADAVFTVMKTNSGVASGINLSSWYVPGTSLGGIVNANVSSVDGGAAATLQLQSNGAGVTINTEQALGQLTVKAGSTSTVGLVVDTPASTTSESISLRYNGSERVRFLNWATLNAIYLTSFDNGTGAGSFFYAQKNSNGSTPAAGFVYLDGLSNSYSIWPDTSGNLRILAGSFPINASDTAGTVIGTQTSTLASKILLGGDLTPGEALRTILQTPVKHFKYKSGAYNHSEFQGIVADYSPEFAMDEGRVFNPVSAVGYLIQGIKALTERITALEAA